MKQKKMLKVEKAVNVRKYAHNMTVKPYLFYLQPSP